MEQIKLSFHLDNRDRFDTKQERWLVDVGHMVFGDLVLPSVGLLGNYKLTMMVVLVVTGLILNEPV